MRNRFLLLPVALLAFGAGCDSTLNVQPIEEIADEEAIVDAVSARSALAGAYDALQDADYYGNGYFAINEVSSDNMEHSGTFTEYGEADDNLLTADNFHVFEYWEAAYAGINRANILIQVVPSVPGMSDAERNQMIGEAHFLRALHYHNLVKEYAGVPIRLVPAASLDEASNISRASVAEVYAQILADLQQAENLITVTRQSYAASDGAVRALRARVMLYQASPGPTGRNTADWAAVEAAATATLNTPGYALATSYSSLFGSSTTTEDIFRVRFTDQDANSVSFYYSTRSLGGRYEVRPTSEIRLAFPAGDVRGTWSIRNDPTRTAANPRYYAAKFPDVAGTDHPHVIRLAELYLIRAEARARQGVDLAGAVDDYNRLRVRAGLAPHVLGVDVVTQADVMAAIEFERRLELAFEGDRWPDLVRSGRVFPVMTAHQINGFLPHQALYPIPQQEIDVTRDASGQPRLVQNPGY